MRRALASLLLVIVSFPLIGAGLFARGLSSLPSCCRRDGKHHCAATETAGEAGSAVAAVQAKCPLFPKGAVTPAASAFILSDSPSAPGAPGPCPAATQRPSEGHRLGSVTIIFQKRGPPL